MINDHICKASFWPVKICTWVGPTPATDESQAVSIVTQHDEMYHIVKVFCLRLMYGTPMQIQGALDTSDHATFEFSDGTQDTKWFKQKPTTSNILVFDNAKLRYKSPGTAKIDVSAWRFENPKDVLGERIDDNTLSITINFAREVAEKMP